MSNSDNPFITALTAPTKEPVAKRAKKKRMSEDIFQTTIRISVETHRRLRELAIHDSVKINDIINEALMLYCDKRGVRLKPYKPR